VPPAVRAAVVSASAMSESCAGSGLLSGWYGLAPAGAARGGALPAFPRAPGGRATRPGGRGCGEPGAPAGGTAVARPPAGAEGARTQGAKGARDPLGCGGAQTDSGSSPCGARPPATPTARGQARGPGSRWLGAGAGAPSGFGGSLMARHGPASSPDPSAAAKPKGKSPEGETPRPGLTSGRRPRYASHPAKHAGQLAAYRKLRPRW
jgi:hypothetical protein